MTALDLIKQFSFNKTARVILIDPVTGKEYHPVEVITKDSSDDVNENTLIVVVKEA